MFHTVRRATITFENFHLDPGPSERFRVGLDGHPGRPSPDLDEGSREGNGMAVGDRLRGPFHREEARRLGPPE